jgi:hypothetical protein
VKCLRVSCLSLYYGYLIDLTKLSIRWFLLRGRRITSTLVCAVKTPRRELCCCAWSRSDADILLVPACCVEQSLYSYTSCVFLYLPLRQALLYTHLQGVGYPMVTEDNAEAYMSMIQGFLTLDAFKTSLAQRATAAMAPSARMTPAYPMVRAVVCQL